MFPIITTTLDFISRRDSAENATGRNLQGRVVYSGEHLIYDRTILRRMDRIVNKIL